ncbi:hypothetical protein HBI18_154700 [Parastagonospora nodorum]|nr:hypothetical protein HBH77_096590 [Parastagonospora nodorum]KAH5720769.1 hypothetical protein HBI18_154700 [Parastagonospora nodorum]KAH6112770.1 hypothetical protein HBI64_212900 [Parastagonospora nodorum]
MANTPPATQQNSRTSTTLSQQPTLVTSTPPGQQPQSNKVPSAAFRSALDEFQKRLTKDELVGFQTTTYSQFCDELHVLQEKQIKRREVMNLSRIAGFLEGMHQLGKTIEVFVNASNMVAFIWGPIKFLLLTGSEYVDSFETLLDAYELIGEQLPLLLERESLVRRNIHMEKALESIYMDILKFHRQALRFFQGNRLKTMIKSMWKSFDTEFQGILASLHRHKDLVEQLTSVSHYSDSAAHYRQYQTDMEDLRDRLHKQIKEEKEKDMVTVVTWLSVGKQAEDDHTEYQKIRSNFSTTATWIFKHEYIKDWINSTVPETSLLWMHGIPGAGKTILASAIIDNCRQKQESMTAFVYCHDGDSNSNSAVAILKGLANMLLDHGQDKDLLLSLFHTKRFSGGDPTLRSIKTIKSLLEQCCAIVPKLFFVVDGLDECDPNERREVLSVLTKLVNDLNIVEPGSLRVLIISQHFPDIQRGVEGSGSAQLAPRIIRITEKEVDSDIVTYIRALVEDIATRNSSAGEPFNENIKEYLRNLTLVNAKGMFLYAKLVLTNLLALPTRMEVINAIQHESFPQGLKEAYERIIKRIKVHSEEAEWIMARKLLGWMICAKRHLTWKEIQVALSINIENETIDYEDRHLRTNIQDICGSLVVMSQDRVTLVHSTAKTHIRENTNDIHEPTVECELATMCLQYLTFPCFRIDPDDGPRELRQHMLSGHFAFQDYAIATWFHHVNAFVQKGEQFLRDADEKEKHLNDLWEALEEFTSFHQEDWYGGIVQSCSEACGMFRPYMLYEVLVQIKSHIYTFQQKGFDARHKISIQGLDAALERNRKILEDPPKDMAPAEKVLYTKFYDDKKLFKCTKITCRYFSQGFSDKKARKRHVNIHDRPFQCEVRDCLGQEGFANEKDLRNHKRSFHPDMCDLAESFKSSIAKRTNAGHACGYCGKTFTRKFHREDHEKSHRGERPHVCSECGRAFTRRNDCERHKKLHERGR